MSDQESTARTDVVLVVKGAGLHKAGDTLSQFIQGFWPAIVKLGFDKDGRRATKSTIRQEHELLKDYDPPPHIKEEHTHLAEISITGPSTKSDKKEEAVSHRILIKEAYWELGQNPPSPGQALLNEWHMATHAFRREITNYLRSFTFRGLKIAPLPILTALSAGLRKIRSRRFRGQTQSIADSIEKRAEGARNFLSKLLIANWEFRFIYLSFFAIYSFFGAKILVSILKDTVDALMGLDDTEGFSEFLVELPQALVSSETWQFIGLLLGFVAVMAFFMSWLPSLQIHSRNTYQEERLPGLQHWILVPLVITFIFNTWSYLCFFLFFLIPIAIVNVSRGLWWNYREDANTDREYETYEAPPEKRNFLILMNLFPLMVVYRLAVVWILPIAFLLLSIAKARIATMILGDFGKTIEAKLNNFLGDKLGDVSAYAMDPAFALRIRSAVEYDIKFFHQMEQVDNIHVFAHSQGTPITFETIFTHMPKEYRGKIKTYVTVGSVLSYYYQIVPVLDEVYFPERFRKTDYELDTFADGFRWFNCWNLADNITEFYGLDEYDLDLKKKDKSRRIKVRYPTNIKTRARGHSDYWTNLDEVQIPFVERVLKDEVDEKWVPEIKSNGKMSFKARVNLTAIFLLILVSPMLALLYLWTRTWAPISSYIGGVFSLLIEALRELAFFKTIIEAVENFKGLDQFFGTVYDNLGWILPAIIAAYVIVQIAKTVGFLWRKRSAPK